MIACPETRNAYSGSGFGWRVICSCGQIKPPLQITGRCLSDGERDTFPPLFSEHQPSKLSDNSPREHDSSHCLQPIDDALPGKGRHPATPQPGQSAVESKSEIASTLSPRTVSTQYRRRPSAFNRSFNSFIDIVGSSLRSAITARS